MRIWKGCRDLRATERISRFALLRMVKAGYWRSALESGVPYLLFRGGQTGKAGAGMLRTHISEGRDVGRPLGMQVEDGPGVLRTRWGLGVEEGWRWKL